MTSTTVDSDALAAKGEYSAAATEIDSLEAFVREHGEQLESLHRDGTRTPEWRQSKAREIGEKMANHVQGQADSIRDRLAHADARAAVALVGEQNDSLMESRKTRAGTRVSRLLAADKGLLEAAEVFASSGDLDALRALRDEIPSHVAAGMRTSNPDALAGQVHDITLSFDQVMRPLLSEREQYAVDVRDSVDMTRQWLDQVLLASARITNGQQQRGLNGLAIARGLLGDATTRP